MLPGRRKGSTQPIVITSADDADKLIFSAACVNNLAVYLTKAKKDVPKTGKIGLWSKAVT
jgi:formate dehydrogenase (coenzyme F420) beta subunit